MWVSIVVCKPSLLYVPTSVPCASVFIAYNGCLKENRETDGSPPTEDARKSISGEKSNVLLMSPWKTASNYRAAGRIQRTPLVIVYNPALPPVGHITRKHHNIIHISERLKQAIQSSIIAFHCPKNLRDLLVWA